MARFEMHVHDCGRGVYSRYSGGICMAWISDECALWFWDRRGRCSVEWVKCCVVGCCIAGKGRERICMHMRGRRGLERVVFYCAVVVIGGGLESGERKGFYGFILSIYLVLQWMRFIVVRYFDGGGEWMGWGISHAYRAKT